VFDGIDEGVVLLRGNVDKFMLHYTVLKNNIFHLHMSINLMDRILIVTGEE